MASNTYGKYYENEYFVISNMDLDKFEWRDDLPKEAMKYPPLEMTILKCKKDGRKETTIADFSDHADFEYNHPKFTKHYLQALQGNLPGWKMAAVKVSAEILQIYFATDQPPVIGKIGDDDIEMNDAMVSFYMYGEAELMFEMNYHDGLPPIRHIVSYVNHSESEYGQVITVTKMIGQRKIRKIEMREDDYEQSKGYYCHVTEY